MTDVPRTDDAPEAGRQAGPVRATTGADASGREWAHTRTSDATTPPPPPAAAVAEAARLKASPEAADLAVVAAAVVHASATGAPRRLPLLVQGVLPALAAVLLAAASLAGAVPLTVVVLVLQAALVLALLSLLDAPAAGGAFVVALVAAVAADVVVVVDDGEIDRLVGVVGLALVAALLHQLVRRGRSRVTESLADTLLVVVAAVAAACLPALHATDGGTGVLLVAVATAAAVLLAGRLVDRLSARPLLAVGATRGWPGLVLGLAVGVLAALGATALATTGLAADGPAALGELDLPLRSAALLGLLVGATVVTADLAVDLGAAELRSGRRDARRVAAIGPTGALLPLALLGPVALLAGRLVLG